MEIAAGMGALGRVFGFRRGEGVGSRPVSSHRRDAEVAKKKRKKDFRRFLRLDGQNSTKRKGGTGWVSVRKEKKGGSPQIRSFDGRLLMGPRDGHTSTSQ